jgi:putative ubiquitin-RnfH superfamily antitoxin RatB of RatAB toxin-antitoxin module
MACLLRHGLDVDFKKGALLSFAIEEKDVDLLDEILSAGPNRASLTAAFRTATYAQPRSLELGAMKLLLEKAKSAEIGQSDSVAEQIDHALSGDFAGLQLLLRHKAVRLASPNTLTKICLATASSKITWYEKQEIFELLLGPGADVLPGEMSKLLERCVTALPKSTQLPQLLLAHGAKVSLETLKAALKTSSLELLDMLVSSVESGGTAARASFRLARRISMASERRYRVYQHLLAKRIPSDMVAEALLDSLTAENLGDLSIPKLLLENGASPGFRNCESFSLALRAKSSNSLVAVRLLTQYLVDDSMATVAFEVIRKTPRLKSHVRVEIYRPLLAWNIGKSSVSQVLTDSFKDGYPDTSFVQLLLAKGADPNKDNGHCFAVAAKRGAVADFQALSKFAKPWVVFKALLENFQEESIIVEWFKLCLHEKPRMGKVDHELAFQCMRKFPGGTILLKLLLDQGVSASAKIDHRLHPSWKPEPCTALIWALFSSPRIENNVILVLLSRGNAGMLSLPVLYCTS